MIDNLENFREDKLKPVARINAAPSRNAYQRLDFRGDSRIPNPVNNQLQ